VNAAGFSEMYWLVLFCQIAWYDILISFIVLQHNMDVTDVEHDPRYESPLTCNKEGLLIEVKEEKDPLLLTYSELVNENEVSSTYSPSETLQSSNIWDWHWHNKTILVI
jgi:hypothetical protein